MNPIRYGPSMAVHAAKYVSIVCVVGGIVLLVSGLSIHRSEDVVFGGILVLLAGSFSWVASYATRSSYVLDDYAITYRKEVFFTASVDIIKYDSIDIIDTNPFTQCIEITLFDGRIIKIPSNIRRVSGPSLESYEIELPGSWKLLKNNVLLKYELEQKVGKGKG